MTIQRITKMAIVAAVYVALTYIFAPISYNELQFRVSEILVLLVFFKRDYIYSLVIGTFIANIGSPLGLYDLAFGTAGTLFAVWGIYLVSLLKDRFKPHWLLLLIASLFPVISNGLLVAWELKIVYALPYWPSVLSVAIGEAVVVCVFGVLVFSLLEKNKPFMNLIQSDNFRF